MAVAYVVFGNVIGPWPRRNEPLGPDTFLAGTRIRNGVGATSSNTSAVAGDAVAGNPNNESALPRGRTFLGCSTLVPVMQAANLGA
jgi:hypothetical protein